MASRNTLLKLDGFVAKSRVVKLADMWPSAVNRYRWDGQRSQAGALYCLPKDIGPNVMFYNKDVLKAHGVPFPDAKTPMTWDQAIGVWKRLSFASGRIQHYGISGYGYEHAVWSNGGAIVSDDKRSWVLNSPKGIEAVQWCADLGLVHKVAPDGSKTAGGSGSSSPGQLFESGLAAMHIDGRWMVPHFRKLSFDWDVAPLPVPRKGAKSVTWSGSVGFGIGAKSAHPQEAFQLVEYMAGPEGQTTMTKSGLQVPNQRWLAKTDVYMQKGQKPEHAEVFLASAADSRPGPWTDTPNTFWHDVYWTFVGKIWRGERKAKDLLPELSPLVNQTLRENNEGAR
jgi:multiple sugar transport system substrate-binding protein